MAKVKNRKKEYKRALKRQGLIKTTLPTKETSPVKSPVQSVAVLSLEKFSALGAVEGIRANLVATLYQAGIRSMADFKLQTEEDLLALKGIGPATVKKLKENGVSLKVN